MGKTAVETTMTVYVVMDKGDFREGEILKVPRCIGVALVEKGVGREIVNVEG